MSEIQVLAWLSPVLVLILMVSVVAIFAIQRARQQDIPLIVREFMAAMRWVADRLPQPPGTEDCFGMQCLLSSRSSSLGRRAPMTSRGSGGEPAAG